MEGRGEKSTHTDWQTDRHMRERETGSLGLLSMIPQHTGSLSSSALAQQFLQTGVKQRPTFINGSKYQIPDWLRGWIYNSAPCKKHQSTIFRALACVRIWRTPSLPWGRAGERVSLTRIDGWLGTWMDYTWKGGRCGKETEFRPTLHSSLFHPPLRELHCPGVACSALPTVKRSHVMKSGWGTWAHFLHDHQ